MDIILPNTTGNHTIIPSVHFNDTDRLIISIVAIVIGIALSFLGRRLFKATLFITGLIAVSGATYYIMQFIALHQESIHYTKVEIVAIPLAVGFVGGCVVLGLVKIGFFLAGAAAGAVISFIVFSLAGAHFGEHAFVIRIVILCALCVICGAIVVYHETKLIILITSLGGAYLTFVGIDHFVKSGYVQAIHSLVINDQNIIPHVHGKLLGMLGGTLALAVFGFIVQTITNKRKRAGWDESEYLLSGKVNY